MIFDNDNYSVILIEGGEPGDVAFVEWLNKHRSELETYVVNGGRVWLNAAANRTAVTQIEMAFGVFLDLTDVLPENVTCAPGAEIDPIYQVLQSCEMRGAPGHGFAHGYLSETSTYGYEPLTIDSNNGNIVLLRIRAGSGEVMQYIMSYAIHSIQILIGSQTITDFQYPIGQVFQFRINQFSSLITGSKFLSRFIDMINI